MPVRRDPRGVEWFLHPYVPEGGTRMSTDLRPCPGCGALVPEVNGPTHRYIGASPGCWAAYGELSGKEAGDFRYMRHHQLTVDAYCAGHPGTPSPQAIRSVAVHLVGLHLQLEAAPSAEELYGARRRIASLGKEGKLDLAWLAPPASPAEITVLHLLGAKSPEEYGELARVWAWSVWESWSEHHETVRRWASV
jgi:hypothetical protein